MKARYRHATASEGIREFISELKKAEDLRKRHDIGYSIYSTKSIMLIATGFKPPRAVQIRPSNEFTVGYTIQTSGNDPGFENHAEVVRTNNGQLYFRENGNLLAASEFLSKLIRLIAAEAEPIP